MTGLPEKKFLVCRLVIGIGAATIAASRCAAYKAMSMGIKLLRYCRSVDGVITHLPCLKNQTYTQTPHNLQTPAGCNMANTVIR